MKKFKNLFAVLTLVCTVYMGGGINILLVR